MTMSDDQQAAPPGPEGGAATPPSAPQAPPAQAPPPAGAPSPGGLPGPASDTSKLLAALGYVFGIVAVVALLIEPYKEEKFVRFHALQAIGLWVAGVVLSTVSGFLTVIPFLGILFAVFAGLIGLALFVYAIFMAIKAWSGEYVEIPVVHGFIEQYV